MKYHLKKIPKNIIWDTIYTNRLCSRDERFWIYKEQEYGKWENNFQFIDKYNPEEKKEFAYIKAAQIFAQKRFDKDKKVWQASLVNEYSNCKS